MIHIPALLHGKKAFLFERKQTECLLLKSTLHFYVPGFCRCAYAQVAQKRDVLGKWQQGAITCGSRNAANMVFENMQL
jgi:hypothetical protein